MNSCGGNETQLSLDLGLLDGKEGGTGKVGGVEAYVVDEGVEMRLGNWVGVKEKEGRLPLQQRRRHH